MGYCTCPRAGWLCAKNFHRKFSLRAAPLKMSTESFLNARPPIWKSMVSLIPVAHARHPWVGIFHCCPAYFGICCVSKFRLADLPTGRQAVQCIKTSKRSPAVFSRPTQKVSVGSSLKMLLSLYWPTDSLIIYS
jgi:hypothetical protein